MGHVAPRVSGCPDNALRRFRRQRLRGPASQPAGAASWKSRRLSMTQPGRHGARAPDARNHARVAGLGGAGEILASDQGHGFRCGLLSDRIRESSPSGVHMRLKPILVSLLVLAHPALSGTIEIAPVPVTEWKPVFGQIETRDRVPARTRLGGTIAALNVTEGDRVEAGATVATIEDVKLGFQIDALEARIEALRSRLETARSDLERGTELYSRGVITSQRLDELQTS